MEIYRAPMRARDLDVPAGAGADFGVDHGLVGIGPGTGPKAERMLERFTALPEGTLVWTRTTDGAFHLGRITGPYRHEDTPQAREVGIHHVRPCEWQTADDVPPAVIATFARGGRNLQRIHLEGSDPFRGGAR